MSGQIIKLTKTVRKVQSSDATAAEPNEARMSYKIQNLGTNVLFVKEGDSASTSDADHVLPGGSGNDDGEGGFYEMPAGQVYTGIITIAGTSPRYTIIQRQEI